MTHRRSEADGSVRLRCQAAGETRLGPRIGSDHTGKRIDRALRGKLGTADTHCSTDASRL